MIFSLLSYLVAVPSAIRVFNSAQLGQRRALVGFLRR